MNVAKPFLQLVVNRAFVALRRLDAAAWQDLGPLPVEATACLPQPLSYADAIALPRTPLALPAHWGKLYDFRWFRVVVPAAVDDRPRFLEWTDQSQATAWLDGCPYHGFDHHHRRVALPRIGGEFWLESSCLSPFIGPWHHFGAEGTRCEGAKLYLRDDAAWVASHRLRVLYDLAIEERHDLLPTMGREPRWIGYQPPLESVHPRYRRVLRWLDQCVDAYDTNGVSALVRALDAAYADLRGGDGFALTAVFSGHAHIDLVWLWPERLGEFKARHTLATVNRLMDRYPEFRFQYSQTASYRAIGRTAPRLLDAVRGRIASGQWEASGAMEVESDTLLACGEALARGFSLGQRRFAELTGSPSRLVWLPDVFGYTACLPQLMRAFGVEFFFTAKITWNALNRFPYSSFVWRGPDGAEVVAHVTHDLDYNSTAAVSQLRTGERAHRQADVHDEFLMPTGHGDGGGGPTDEMCERARHLADLSGLPRVKWDLPTPFFDRLGRIRDRLPVYEGELYLEYHRGTYTTQGAVKAAFRGAERALQAAEAVHAARGLGSVNPTWWDRVIFAQFHDYIPGTSVPPVYQQAMRELSRIAADAHASATQALALSATPAGPADILHWFNPLPLPLRVNLPDARVLDLPPLSSLAVDASGAAVEPVVVSAHHLANGLVEARFDAHGRLVALHVRGRAVKLAGPAGELWLYQDHPALFQAWDIDRQALDTGRAVDAPATITTETSPDGSAALVVARALGGNSQTTVRYRLRPGRDVLEIEADVDWQEPQTLLKLAFPTAYTGQLARFGGPFGSTLRSQKPGEPRAEAMWEVPGSRWAVVTDDSGAEGLFLVTEAKYGFSCRDGRLALSLLRSPVHTGMDGEDHGFMYPRAIRTEPEVPRYTDIGRHVIRLAVGLYRADSPRESMPATLAETLYAAPLAYTGAPVSAGLLAVEGDASILPSWAQPLEGGAWVLRLHETLGRHGDVALSLAPGRTAQACGFDGDVAFGTPTATRFTCTPYQILSVRISA